MKERGKKEVAESGGRGILTQGRDGSPSGPTFAWKGGTGVSPVYVGKRGNLIDRLGALPQHTAGTAMPHSQTTGAAPAYALGDSGLASCRESGTPAARHPYQLISKGAAAPLVRLVFSIVPQGRDGSPSGPKSQAQSAVSGTGAAPVYALRDSGLASRRESGTPAASGSSPTPRRARHPYQLISRGAAAPLVRLVFSIVPKGRDGSPSGPTFCRGRLSQLFLRCLPLAGFLFCVLLMGCERQQPPGPPPPVAQTPSPTPKIELGEPPRMP
jgi:hypothetical protein